MLLNKEIKPSLICPLMLSHDYVFWFVLFTNPSARAGYDTRSIFKRSLTGFSSEFSFSLSSCLTKAEEPFISLQPSRRIHRLHFWKCLKDRQDVCQLAQDNLLTLCLVLCQYSLRIVNIFFVALIVFTFVSVFTLVLFYFVFLFHFILFYFFTYFVLVCPGANFSFGRYSAYFF